MPPKAISWEIERERIRRIAAERESLETYTLESIEYGSLSSSEIRRLAGRIHITNPDIRAEGTGTLNDPRMGPSKRGMTCNSCHGTMETCQGHIGYIELAIKVCNPAFIDTIIKTLSCVCRGCAEPLFNPAAIRPLLALTGHKRLDAIYNRSSTFSRACSNPECRISTQYAFAMKESKEQQKVMYKGVDKIETLSGESVYLILNAITDETAELLGFRGKENHPRNLVLEVLPVLPPADRPNVRVGDREKANPFTEAYSAIIRHNNALKAILDAKTGRRETKISRTGSQITVSEPRHSIEVEESDQLIRAIARLYGTNTTGFTTQKTVDSIRTSLNGKTGLFRGGLMSKRMDYVGRSVIGPDPNIPFGYAAIPAVMASKLLHPEYVFQHNKHELQALLAAGKVATYIPARGPKAGQRIPILTPTQMKTIILEEGDRVERHLRDGDQVLLNRQPSIHTESMRSFKAIVGPWLTIRLHLSDYKAFNADNDGDEINVIKVRSLPARAEAEVILNTEACIISPQRSSPIIGLHMDAITGIADLTDPAIDHDNRFTPSEVANFMTLLTATDQLRTVNSRLALAGVSPYSGRGVFSLLLPADFYYEGKPGENSVLIENGVLIRGKVVGAHTGPKPRSIIQALINGYGKERTSQFITDATRLAYAYLALDPVTVSIVDCIPADPALARSVATISRDAVMRAQLSVDALGTPPEDPEERGNYEDKITSLLGNAQVVGKRTALEAMAVDNNLKRMVNAGAKGDAFNLGQIYTGIGQQYINGRRPRVPAGTGRITPYDPHGSTMVQAMGYVEESYGQGLSMRSLYFIQAAGREDLSANANSVAEVGKKHRELVKALEDATVNYYGHVVDAFSKIYQIVYGGNALAPEKCLLVYDPSRGYSYPAPYDPIELKRAVNLFYGSGWDRKAFIEDSKRYPPDQLLEKYIPYWTPGSVYEIPTAEPSYQFLTIPSKGTTWRRNGYAWYRLLQAAGIEDLSFALDIHSEDAPSRLETILTYGDRTVKRIPYRDIELYAGTEYPRGRVGIITRQSIFPALISYYSNVPELSTLSPEEIANAAEEIKADTLRVLGAHIPPVIRNSMAEEHASFVRRFLSHPEYKVVPGALPLLLDIFKHYYGRALIDPGSSVGMRVADAMSAPIMQAVLNTFHMSGAAGNARSSLDTINQFLNLRDRKISSMTIHFKNRRLTYAEVAAYFPLFVTATVGKLTIGWDYNDPKETVNEPWYPFALTFLEKRVPECTAMIRLRLNVQLLYRHRITTEEVAQRIEATFNEKGERIVVIPSPTHLGIIDIYPNDANCQNDDGSVPEVSSLYLTSTVEAGLAGIVVKGIPGITDFTPQYWLLTDMILRESGSEDGMRILHLNRRKIVSNGVPLSRLEELLTQYEVKVVEKHPETWKVSSPRGPVKELLNREYTRVTREEKEAKRETKEAALFRYYYAETKGSNIAAVGKISFVDNTRTFSDDWKQMVEYYGIEMTRAILIREANKILSMVGEYVNPSHITLLVDYMTRSGGLAATVYHGIAKSGEVSILASATQSSAFNQYTRSIVGAKETITSVSASVAVGAPLRIGSGLPKLKKFSPGEITAALAKKPLPTPPQRAEAKTTTPPVPLVREVKTTEGPIPSPPVVPMPAVSDVTLHVTAMTPVEPGSNILVPPPAPVPTERRRAVIRLSRPVQPRAGIIRRG